MNHAAPYFHGGRDIPPSALSPRSGPIWKLDGTLRPLPRSRLWFVNLEGGANVNPMLKLEGLYKRYGEQDRKSVV